MIHINIYMFKDRVLNILKNIPKGETLSYKEVAERANSPRAYRKVGSIMKANYDTTVPCHRVIKSNGTIGQYNKGVNLKYKKLKEEGAV